MPNDTTLAAFLARFADSIEGVDVERLEGATDFRSLEQWDSLAVLATLAMADAEYGVAVTAREILGCATLADLHRLVISRRE